MEEAMSQRRLLPVELMLEILSLLPVKTLIRFRCVNKFFKTLISDPYFVKIHLNKSSQNSHLALMMLSQRKLENSSSSSSEFPNYNLVTLSIPGLLQNQFVDRRDDYLLTDGQVVGSCNGLLLIATTYLHYPDNWFYLCNPSMRTKSEICKTFSDNPSTLSKRRWFKFSFGYDISTTTYKIVAFNVEVKYGCNPKTVVKVLSLGDNSWRVIQCFPLIPLHWFDDHYNGVHLNGTINWMAPRDVDIFTVDRYVILSLDLSTETYTQLLLPQRFDRLPRSPKLVVLMDCLCFCHDFKETHFVIWQMKNFGAQDSWVQLFKISYQHFFKSVDLSPLYLSKNGDTLILANDEDKEAFIYNHTDKTIEKIRIANHILWSQANDYVESLVSTH